MVVFGKSVLKTHFFSKIVEYSEYSECKGRWFHGKEVKMVATIVIKPT